MPSRRARLSSSVTSHINSPLIFWMMWFPRAMMSYWFQSLFLIALASCFESPNCSTTFGLWSVPILTFWPRSARVPR